MTDAALSGWAGARETNVSAVYFLGEKVLKVKKPVRTDFLDFTTVESRRRACEDEVRLNRRLSPDVYLGVADIELGDASPEPAVVMRRLADQDNLAARVGGDPARLMTAAETVARQIAAFHERVPVATGEDSPGAWRRIIARWRREWDAVEHLDPGLDPSQRRGADRGLGLRYLAGRQALFEGRLRAGKIRDGHGDLRADHVYLTGDGVRIVDCLEFDADLRTCDVLADVAFLAMDLERLGEGAAADHFLAVHRELTDDVYPRSLLDFYIAQRALVRLKVAKLRPGARTRLAMSEEDLLLDLAEAHLVAAQPVLVCIGGLPGSGKSTVATALAAREDLVYLSSDAVRHEASIGAARGEREGWGTGRYQESAVAAVYDDLLGRARTALGLGYSVILDASWRDPAQRARARAAAEHADATLVELRCVIDDHTAYQRLSASRPGFSEAGPAERQAMQREFASWPTARSVPTDGEIARSVALAEEVVGASRQSTIAEAARYAAQLGEVATAEPASAGYIDHG